MLKILLRSCFALVLISLHCSWAKNPLPLPRFASLKATKIHLRTGPGSQHPITWIYHKQHLPVMIIAEYENWRQIEDHEGTTGWVHHSMLSGKRYVLIVKKNTPMFKSHDLQSALKAYLDLTILGLIKEIKPTMAYIKVDDYKGWVERTRIWGILKTE